MLYIKDLQLLTAKKEFPNIKELENFKKHEPLKERLTSRILEKIIWEYKNFYFKFEGKNYIMYNSKLFDDNFNLIGIYASPNKFLNNSFNLRLDAQWYFTTNVPIKLFNKFKSYSPAINYVNDKFFTEFLNKPISLATLEQDETIELFKQFLGDYLPRNIKNINISEEGNISFEPVTIDLTQELIEQEVITADEQLETEDTTVLREQVTAFEQFIEETAELNIGELPDNTQVMEIQQPADSPF